MRGPERRRLGEIHAKSCADLSVETPSDTHRFKLLLLENPWVVHHQHVAFLFYYLDDVCSQWYTFTRRPTRSRAETNGLTRNSILPVRER
jgi:hypothetical protein